MYTFALPHNFSYVHLLFYVSMLKRYHGNGDDIIKSNSIVLDKDLQYEEELISILDCDARKLTTKEIKSVKFQWKNCPLQKGTWVTEKGHARQVSPIFH